MPTVAEIQTEQLREDLARVANEQGLTPLERVAAYLPFAKRRAGEKFLHATSETSMNTSASQTTPFSEIQMNAARLALICLRKGVTGPSLREDKVLEGMERVLWHRPYRAPIYTIDELRERRNAMKEAEVHETPQ